MSAYWRDLMTLHMRLDIWMELKQTFLLSETEYMASATLLQEIQQPMRPIQQVIYSNVKDIVEQQKYVFESFWNKAIPAENRIKEIEEGFVLGVQKLSKSHQEQKNYSLI